MRMAWWIFMSLLSVQIILIQYMLESFYAGHPLWHYVLALGFMAVVSWFAYLFFRKMDEVKE
jgi:hypothetical protein